MVAETFDRVVPPSCMHRLRSRITSNPAYDVRSSWRRIFPRRRLTISQRCFAMHFYLAAPRSALERD